MVLALCACGPSATEPTPPPSEEEAQAAIEAFCEQPVVPCRNESCVPEAEDCLTLNDCVDEAYFFYDDCTPECQHLKLDLLRCQTGMTCEEEEEDRMGISGACDKERDACRSQCDCCI